MADLQAFREETKSWLAENCPKGGAWAWRSSHRQYQSDSQRRYSGVDGNDGRERLDRPYVGERIWWCWAEHRTNPSAF